MKHRESAMFLFVRCTPSRYERDFQIFFDITAPLETVWPPLPVVRYSFREFTKATITETRVSFLFFPYRFLFHSFLLPTLGEMLSR